MIIFNIICALVILFFIICASFALNHMAQKGVHIAWLTCFFAVTVISLCFLMASFMEFVEIRERKLDLKCPTYEIVKEPVYRLK